MNRLAGKFALVTGASRGIGRAIALRLAREGADVAITYAQNREMAETVAAEIQTLGRRCLCRQMNVAQRDSVRTMVTAIRERWNRLDILVNNAGILQLKPFAELTDVDWDDMLAVNLKSVFLCSQETLPLFKNQGGGTIINISSVGGQTGGTMSPHYAAAKAGVISLTKSTAKIMAPWGVTVNAIAPGYIRTDMYDTITSTTESEADIERKVPLGKAGEAPDVAAAAAFLASSDARYITGQVINVNGGVFV